MNRRQPKRERGPGARARMLPATLPFDALERQALINPDAREADAADDFSACIRSGRAGFEK